MLYGLEQGPTEQNILEQAARMGMPIPKAIQNAPEMHLGLQLYYSGFLDLNNSRYIGMEEGSIPWDAIQSYCVANELTADQTEDMHHHVVELDITRSKYIDGKKDKKSGKSGGFRT